MNPRLYVMLDQIRSAHNVGSVFRTCDSAGVNGLYLIGISAHPPHPKLLKTALGSTDSVSWEYHEELFPLITTLQQKKIKLVALETTPSAKSIFNQPFNSDTCLIFGNEVSGISPTLLTIADTVIRIPQFGRKDSLNISVAAGIGIYEYRRKLLAQTSGIM